MDQEEIIKRLEKIKFNRIKHKTIKEALKEIIDSDKYSPAMRGIITDNKIKDELQDIIKAYKELQEVDISEIEEVTKQLTEKVEILEEQTYTEVIVDSDIKNYYLKHKNSETGEYEDIKSFTDLKFYDGYCDAKDGIYNYLGKKIFDKKDFDYKDTHFVSNKIIKLEKNEECIYISINGLNKIDFKDYDKLAFKNIDMILNRCSNKDKFFDFIISGKDLSYLEYEVISVTGEYLYCVKDKEKCYFNLDGEKIITTDDYVYSDIIDMEKNIMSVKNRRHLVVVGDFDDKFNRVYGYYDLDERRQITELEYKEADNFTNNFTRVKDRDDNLKLLNIDEDKKIRVMDGSFLRKELFSTHYTDYHIYSCNKLDDDVYEFSIKEQYYFSCDYLLFVKDLKTSFKCIYRIFTDDNYLSIYINDIYTFYNRILEGYYYLNENYEKEVLTVSRFLKNKFYQGLTEKTKTQELLPILKNSSFLLPIYKENKNALMCLTNQEDNELVIKDIYELSNVTYIPNSQRVINVNNNNFDDDVITEFSPRPFGSLIYGKIKKGYKKIPCVFNFKDGICIQNDNFVLKNIDYLENIHIEVFYGKGEKQYLLDKLGNVVLGPVDNIDGPRNDMYIITNKGKMQLYQNGVPVSYQADSISWVKKHYVNKNGISVKNKDLLKFRNGNNIYIVDDDGEKIIRQTQDALDLQKVLFGLEFDDLLGIEEGSVKSYVKHK